MQTLYLGGDNCKKVQEAIKRLWNERYPGIVVTVDLLTTGIDVPEITALVFISFYGTCFFLQEMSHLSSKSALKRMSRKSILHKRGGVQ